MFKLLRWIDWSHVWLNLKVLAAWLAVVLTLIIGLRRSFVADPMGKITGYVILLAGIILLGLWIRWCIRISATEERLTRPCEICSYYRYVEEALDQLVPSGTMREARRRAVLFQTLDQAESDAWRANAAPRRDTPVAPPVRELLTHGEHDDHPDTEYVTPPASGEDTGRHWRRTP